MSFNQNMVNHKQIHQFIVLNSYYNVQYNPSIRRPRQFIRLLHGGRGKQTLEQQYIKEVRRDLLYKYTVMVIKYRVLCTTNCTAL